jgi:hypothetical protein
VRALAFRPLAADTLDSITVIPVDASALSPLFRTQVGDPDAMQQGRMEASLERLVRVTKLYKASAGETADTESLNSTIAVELLQPRGGGHLHRYSVAVAGVLRPLAVSNLLAMQRLWRT